MSSNFFNIEANAGATLKEVAHQRYKGAGVKASRHRSKRYPDPQEDGRQWQCAGYVSVALDNLPPEWKVWERGEDKYPGEAWAANSIFFPFGSPWDGLPFHCGVTYQDVLSFGDGSHTVLEVGCDWGHLYDRGDMELSDILRQMRGVVDALCDCLGVSELGGER